MSPLPRRAGSRPVWEAAPSVSPPDGPHGGHPPDFPCFPQDEAAQKQENCSDRGGAPQRGELDGSPDAGGGQGHIPHQPGGGQGEDQPQRHPRQYRRSVLQELEEAQRPAGEAHRFEHPHVLIVRLDGAADAVAQNHQHRRQQNCHQGQK